MSSGILKNIDRLACFFAGKEKLLRVVAIIAALGFLLTIWLLRDRVAELRAVGYPGVFLLSFLGSSTMFLPVPGLLSICAVAVLLNPLIVGIVGALGETLGELTGYTLGYGGRSAIESNELYLKVQKFMEKRGTLLLFAVSTIPNPIFDIVGVAAGVTRMPIARFLIIVFIGKTIKSIGVAYACYYGVSFLPWM